MAITQSTDLNSAATTAYEQAARFELRSRPVYSTLRTVKPTNASHRGSTVRFSFYDELPTSVAALTENADVTPDTMGDSNVDVTINEYGQAVGVTRKLKGTGYLEYDSDMATLNGRRMADSYDILARDALMAGTQVAFAGAAANRAALDDATAGHRLNGADVREIVAQLRGDSVDGYMGDTYMAIVHPDQSVDLREETGDAAWVTSVNYQERTPITSGIVGTYGGALFVETPRTPVVVDGGAGTSDVYRSLFVGSEALACAYAANVCGEMPSVEISPVTDKLNRFHHIGWYWLGGFKVLRDKAVWQLETSSRLGV